MAEVLVFAQNAAQFDFDGVDVVHRSSARLFVVDVGALTAPPFADESNVFRALSAESDFTDELRRRMSPEEQLFAQSWLVKNLAQGKNRRADGADWDTQGFEVPDATNNNDAPD